MSFSGPSFFELSFAKPQEQFEGSAFKPLSLLAHHPWVRASTHHRSTPSDALIPRLPFLMQYYYLNGQYPPSCTDDPNEEGEEDVDPNNRSSHSESSDEGSTISDTGSESDDSFTVRSLDPPTSSLAHLSDVIRPSCKRSPPSSSSYSSYSSSSSMASGPSVFTFRSRHGRRQRSETLPNAGLSVFHDVFVTSICPSTDILFPIYTSPRRESPKKRRPKRK